MKNYLRSLVLVLVVFALQGCVVWRYTTTPPATGRVVDAASGNPIAGAEVGFRKHESVGTHTAADGTFKLASDHSWEPAFIIPAEFTPCGGVFYIDAPGYEPFEKDVGKWAYQLQQFPDVKLQKKEQK